MDKKISREDLKAAAENAIALGKAATEAKAAADEAGGADEALNTAATEAATTAAKAKSDADALSQDFNKQVDKMRIKRKDIDRTLAEVGADDEDEEDDDDDEDDSKPVTRGDLKRINADNAKKTVSEMVAAIPDEADRAAVQSALATRISPALVTTDPKAAFDSAVAIANAGRNSKIIEEAARRGKPVTRIHGAGAPPKVEEAFEPTAQERSFMGPPWNMTEAEIKKARG